MIDLMAGLLRERWDRVYAEFYAYGLKIQPNERGREIYITVPVASEFKDDLGNEMAGEYLAKKFKDELTKDMPEEVKKQIHVKYTTYPMKWNTPYREFASKIISFN